MFDALGGPGVAQLREWARALAESEVGGGRAGLIDQIRALEELACAARARQARLTARFDEEERAAQATAGVPVERQGRGVAEQVALARRV
ncbi:MAG: HNH endonuclease, partial [Actinomycetia bacterium]|nr:HNH endonuclease [Actinomycetes bacterium]